MKQLIFVGLIVVLVFIGKHAVDTGFWSHPSTDLLDVLR